MKNVKLSKKFLIGVLGLTLNTAWAIDPPKNTGLGEVEKSVQTIIGELNRTVDQIKLNAGNSNTYQFIDFDRFVEKKKNSLQPLLDEYKKNFNQNILNTVQLRVQEYKNIESSNLDLENKSILLQGVRANLIVEFAKFSKVRQDYFDRLLAGLGYVGLNWQHTYRVNLINESDKILARSPECFSVSCLLLASQYTKKLYQLLWKELGKEIVIDLNREGKTLSISQVQWRLFVDYYGDNSQFRSLGGSDAHFESMFISQSTAISRLPHRQFVDQKYLHLVENIVQELSRPDFDLPACKENVAKIKQDICVTSGCIREDGSLMGDLGPILNAIPLDQIKAAAVASTQPLVEKVLVLQKSRANLESQAVQFEQNANVAWDNAGRRISSREQSYIDSLKSKAAAIRADLPKMDKEISALQLRIFEATDMSEIQNQRRFCLQFRK
jgi:hypothetical protein